MSNFKLWSELHPEVKPKIKREIRWYYFKKKIKYFPIYLILIFLLIATCVLEAEILNKYKRLNNALISTQQRLETLDGYVCQLLEMSEIKDYYKCN